MNGRISELAETVARTAHDGQFDKAGQPYISHPARVAARVADDEHAVVVAWLHDVVEDTATTLTELAATFPAAVVRAVDALTKRPGEPVNAYYARVRAVPLARRVKLADLADNSDATRLARLDPATRERLRAKYAHAHAVLD